MARPLRLGGRVLWTLLLVSCAFGAPNQDRRKLRVSAAFGARPKDAAPAAPVAAVHDEPKIITEALPGQEFVFISANPAGRAARINHEVAAPPPSARVEIGDVPTVVDEDGILVAARPADLSHQPASVRTGRQAFQEPKLEPFIIVAENWTPQDEALAREESELAQESAPSPVVVPERFTLSDALPAAAAIVPSDAAQGTDANREALDAGRNEPAAKSDVILPAETLSTRTVIKKAPNGEDYVYEYLYYDESDTVGEQITQEPSLFEQPGDEQKTEQPEQPEAVEEAPAGPEAAPVSEEPHVAVETWTVGSEGQLDEAVEEEVATTTTTTTTEEPTTVRRRRPTRPRKTKNPNAEHAEEEGLTTRFPPRSDSSDETGVQARLRVIDSSSFRTPGGVSGERVVETDSFRPTVDAGSFRNTPVETANVPSEPITVGRLTIISGPARLPAPVEAVEQVDDSSSEKHEEKQEDVNVEADSEEDVKVADKPQVILAVPFEEATESGILKAIREEFETKEEQEAELPAIAPTRPDIVDLLAFSRTVEAEEEHHEPAIEEVVVVDEVASTTVPAPVFEAAPVELTVTEAPEEIKIEEVFQQEEAHVPTEAPVVQAVQEDEVHQEVAPVVQAVQEDEVQQEVAPVVQAVQEDEVQQEVAPVVQAAPEPVEDEETEAPTTTTSTTTSTTTTTTTTEAPTTTTTEAPRIRGSSRFGASNNNKFANRIRNRERDGAQTVRSTTTTTTTTAAPTRRSNLRGNTFNGRLRRPSTTEAPVALVVEESADEKDEVSSTTAAPRRTTPSIRNRFNFRRNFTSADGDEAVTSTTTRRPTTERRAPSPRTRPSASGNSRPVDSSRPASPLFRRGRPTTTTQEPSVAPVVDDLIESATESIRADDSSAEVAKEEAPVTEPSTTSTTTTKLTGLNRLRNRNPIAVSERPRVTRPQISVDDRRVRNRLRVNPNKKAGEAADNDVAQSERVEVKVPKDSEEPAEIATPFRGLRHQRRPGQFAPNRRAQVN